MTTPTSEPVDILLIGGPSDGCVGQIDPTQEDGYSVRCLNGPHKGLHHYRHFAMPGGDMVWNFGVHESLDGPDDLVLIDEIMRTLIKNYQREELVIYVQPA